MQLPAGPSTSCQLKEFMTQIQAKHWTEAEREGGDFSSVEGSSAKLHHQNIQLRRPNDLMSIPCFENTNVCIHTNLHRHTFSRTGILRLFHSAVEKAALGNQHDSEESLGLCDSTKVPTRCYDSAAVSSHCFWPCHHHFHSSQWEVLGKAYRHFLGITQQPRHVCF